MIAPVATRNAPVTSRSTSRVSQLPIGRGTIRVPISLTAAVITSSAPTPAATSRAAIGTTMALLRLLGIAEPTGGGQFWRLPPVSAGAADKPIGRMTLRNRMDTLRDEIRL